MIKQPKRPLWKTAAAVLTAAVLAGCAAPGTVPPGGEPQLLANVKAGTVELDCSLTCVPVYMFQQQRIAQLYNNQQWAELGVTVAKTGYRRDITYFFLGAAAEGMQAWAAADRYYRMAGALATGKDNTAQCSSVKGMCMGFNFPRDIVQRLQVVSAAQGRAPVSARDLKTVGTGLARAGEVDFMPEAPQALLTRYAAQRLFGPGSGNVRRDQAFQNQLLELMDAPAHRASRNNEIARPRAVQALTDRLGNGVEEQRLVLGMWLELEAYDAATQTFGVRYPLFSRSRQPRLLDSVYGGASPRRAPRGHAERGHTCVWENSPGDYGRADEADAYFLLLTLCQPRPQPAWSATFLAPASAELPPTTQLRLPALPDNGLWPRVRVDIARAEALLRRIGSERMVWAELVFDVRAVGAFGPGPFTQREVVQQRVPGMVAAIVPRALFVWQQPPEPEEAGQMLTFAGDVTVGAPVPGGRLPRNLVADRSYDGMPAPVIADRPQAVGTPAAGSARRGTAGAAPRGGSVQVPSVLQPAPLPGTGTGAARPAPKAATPAPAPKPQPAKDDEEDWVEPPPVRR